ncbi:MAG TPA: VWA domain-containing protein [Pyrinomonadaceae bacterium]|jgi:VWFA-related protein
MLAEKRLLLWVCCLFCCAASGFAQERARTVRQSGSAGTQEQQAEDVVHVNTRVVFIDALVRDKRTNLPVRGLTREDFQVLDNGRPRALTYFTREGDARRPLALVLCLNLDYIGARRYLEREDVRASLAAALARLAPEDEVAVMAVWETMGGKPIMVAGLTRDRAKAVAALAPPPDAAEASKSARPVSVMNEATQAAIDIARRERPNSQVVFLYVSDGFATNDMLEFGSRETLAGRLIEGNVNFSALTCDMLKGMSAAVAVASVPLRILGASITGGEQYLAKQTGGVAVKVSRPEEFGAGLQQITTGLASRYSLGFTLGENERDDGQMHRLEVKVKAKDPQGRGRKLTVSARRGYYPKR